MSSKKIEKISIFCSGQEKVVNDIYKIESILVNEFNGKHVALHLLNSNKMIKVFYLSVVDHQIFYTYVKDDKENLFSIKDVWD